MSKPPDGFGIWDTLTDEWWTWRHVCYSTSGAAKHAFVAFQRRTSDAPFPDLEKFDDQTRYVALPVWLTTKAPRFG